MIDRLKELQANKGQFANAGELSKSLTTNIALRAEIDFLSKAFLNKTVSGCSNCYFDAYMELLYLNLEKAMKKIECEFELLSGAVLKDINGNRDYNCSNFNITNELALYHLKSNPNCIDQFQKTPKNLEEQLEAYKLPELASKAIAVRKEADSKNIDKLNGIIESRNIEISNLKSEIETKDNRIIELEGQVEAKDKEITRLTSHSNGFTGEVYQDDEEIDLNTLDRIALLDLIKSEEYNIEVSDEMSDDDIRDAIVRASVAGATDEQKQAEDTLVLEIADRIKKGETKTSIKESLKDGKVGEKNLTQRFIAELVARADELNK